MRVFKSQVRVFLNTSPDIFRVGVRVFLESGFSLSPSPGFEVCPVSGIKNGFYIVLYWLFGTPILAGFDRVMYGRQCHRIRNRTRRDTSLMLGGSADIGLHTPARERRPCS